jgi:triosephosphate isomerase
MSRQKIVAGNWKMNTDAASAGELVKAILQHNKASNAVVKIVCPPFPFLSEVYGLLKDREGFYTGAQNCSQHAKGAYTGEVSAEMLKSVGCGYVLVGHSERRTYFQENDEQLVAKINEALKHSLKVIFCFGEWLEQRKQNTHFETVEKQLRAVLSQFPVDRLKDLVLAYEPVWAIGTGETASPQQAQDMHAHVRSVFAGLFSPQAASEVSILYGGSCNAQNAAELFACADVDGGLIGGASLKAEDFTKIIEAMA